MAFDFQIEDEFVGLCPRHEADASNGPAVILHGGVARAYYRFQQAVVAQEAALKRVEEANDRAVSALEVESAANVLHDAATDEYEAAGEALVRVLGGRLYDPETDSFT